MRRPVKSWRSIWVLLVVMIAAPLLPTAGVAPAILSQLAHNWRQLTSLGEIALLAAGLRVLGGCAALFAAARLIRSVTTLSRAAEALSAGRMPAQTRSGIAEIDGVLHAMAAAARSLTRRSEEYETAEAARRDGEARLRDFAECGSDWYWETDPDHRFCSLSDHIRAFGQDPTSRLGRTRWELVSEGDRNVEKWRDHIALLEKHQPFRDFTYTRKVGDQREQTVSVSGRPIFGCQGQFRGYRGTARDISEEVRAERLLREAKAEAEAANLAKSQFLANMSHELRTPLNAVIGFSEMLVGAAAGAVDGRQREYLDYIRQSGAHLLDTINEILDLAKIDAGNFQLDVDQGLDARALAASCVALVAERAAAGGLTLSAESETGLPRLAADGARLKQVLLNLLGNAVKFTDRGGTVALAVRRAADGGVEFEVTDTGEGMTADEVEVAIEPFGQLDAGLAGRREGTGLGLPLARRLTELHGGSFSIDSEKGNGTTVIVSLPASRAISGPGFPTPDAAAEIRAAAAVSAAGD
jgi:PAS domain S-box-containing protein